jgi:hypothetical protein
VIEQVLLRSPFVQSNSSQMLFFKHDVGAKGTAKCEQATFGSFVPTSHEVSRLLAAFQQGY